MNKYFIAYIVGVLIVLYLAFCLVTQPATFILTDGPDSWIKVARCESLPGFVVVYIAALLSLPWSFRLPANARLAVLVLNLIANAIIVLQLYKNLDFGGEMVCWVREPDPTPFLRHLLIDITFLPILAFHAIWIGLTVRGLDSDERPRSELSLWDLLVVTGIAAGGCCICGQLWQGVHGVNSSFDGRTDRTLQSPASGS